MPQISKAPFLRTVAGYVAVAAVGLPLASLAVTAQAQDQAPDRSSSIPAPPSITGTPPSDAGGAPRDMPSPTAASGDPSPRADSPADAMPDLRSALPSTDVAELPATPAPVDAAAAVNSDDLIGSKVRNSSNEVVGRVDSLLLSPDARVAGVVIGVGGFLGLGVHEVVVPMEQISMIDDDNVSLPSATKEELKAEPAYQRPKANR
ncbi:MAG TPA: PRC-barrel domain-containing protein [Alphaproteobacteria bacterium]|jgi:hypothetical protein